LARPPVAVFWRDHRSRFFGATTGRGFLARPPVAFFGATTGRGFLAQPPVAFFGATTGRGFVNDP